MELIATYWWVWLVCLVGSVIFMFRSFFDDDMSDVSMRKTLYKFIPIWISAGLLVVSIIINIIDYAKA